jgi:hypothetical protein
MRPPPFSLEFLHCYSSLIKQYIAMNLAPLDYPREDVFFELKNCPMVFSFSVKSQQAETTDISASNFL